MSAKVTCRQQRSDTHFVDAKCVVGTQRGLTIYALPLLCVPRITGPDDRGILNIASPAIVPRCSILTGSQGLWYRRAVCMMDDQRQGGYEENSEELHLHKGVN